MKRNRIIFLILWVLSLVGISVRGGAITYGFFFLMTLIPVVSLLYILLVMLTFKVYQRVEGREIICNRSAVFYFSLQNESPFLFSGVKAEFFSSYFTLNDISDGTEYELLPGSGIRKQTEMVCHYRGEYEVGIKRLIVQDFFRLFSIPYRNREPYVANVKPDIVTLTTLRSDQLSVSAKQANAGRDEPDQLSRDYVPGDDIRRINWKVSATENKLMVRKTCSEQREGIGIVFDPERYGNRKEVYLPVENKILEAVIALTLYVSRQGIPVSVCFLKNAPEVMQVDRESGFDALYDEASGYVFKQEGTADLLYEELLRSAFLYDKKTVFLIVHRWSSRLSALADRLFLNNVSVVVYLVGDEDAGNLTGDSRIKVIPVATSADLREVM